MATLTRDLTKTILDRPVVEVDMTGIEGWDGVVVKLRAMDGKLRSRVEQEWLDGPKDRLPPYYKERVLARCIVDDAGSYVFATASEDGSLVVGQADLDAMASLSGAAIDRIYHRAAAMNGLDNKAVETAAKN